MRTTKRSAMTQPANTVAERPGALRFAWLDAAWRRPAVVGALILALLGPAAALRIYDLTGKDIWVDEANGILMARSGLRGLLEHLKLDSSPPLYYLLLGAWMRLFGDSEAAVRSLSVVAGVVTAGAVLAIGWRLFGKTTGLLGAVLVAVAPTHVFYSQQARMYTLLGLLGLLSSYWLWCAIEYGHRRHLFAYALATLGALYTHNFAMHLLPAHALILLWSGAWKRQWKRWAICGLAIATAYLPWLPVFLGQLNNPRQYAWYARFWDKWGIWGAVRGTLFSFSPGEPRPFYQLAETPAISYSPVLLCGLTLLTGLLLTFAGISANNARIRRAAWLTGATALPLLAALCTSLLSTPNYVGGRVDQMVYPSFALLLAVALSGIRFGFLQRVWTAARYVLAAVLVYNSCAGLAHLYGNQLSDGDRALARAIASKARPGDAVVFTGLTRAPVEYYLTRWNTPATLFSYPREAAAHLGNLDATALANQPALLQAEVNALQEELRACPPHAQVFVVFTNEPMNDVLGSYLSLPEQRRRWKVLGKFRPAGLRGEALLLLLRPPW